MKKLLSLGLIAAMFLASCGPDETTPVQKTGGESGEQGLTVEKTQRSILWYWTATWCPPCGSTGSPLFKQLIDENVGVDLIAIDLHSSNSSRLAPGYIDPADNAPKVALGMAGQLAQMIRPNGYIPLFTLNNEFQGNSSLNVGSVNEKILNNNAEEATVGVAASASVDGSTITVKTKTKFFSEGSGDYHISVLLLEKDVTAYQNVGGVDDNNFNHKKVVRASLMDGEMHNQKGISSESIASGTVAANTEIEGEYSLNYVKAQLPDGYSTWDFDKTNTTAVVIIWKKNGAIYDTVNAIEIDL